MPPQSPDPLQSSRLVILTGPTSVSAGSGFPSRPKTGAPAGIASFGSDVGGSVGEASGFPTGVAVAPRRRRAVRERIWMNFMVIALSGFG